MSFSVLLHPRAVKFLEKLDETNSSRIKDSLKTLEENPNKGERLSISPFWRLRIGDYRAIYEIDTKGNRVLILFIGHRENVYDDFSKLF